MKLSQKQQLITEKDILNDKINTFIKTIGEQRILDFISDNIDTAIENIDEEIEDELNFARENPPGSTYASAGKEAKQMVKQLRIIKKKNQKVKKLFDSFVKMKKKVDAL